MWVKQNLFETICIRSDFSFRKKRSEGILPVFFVFRQDPNAGAKDKLSCGDEVTNCPMKVTPNTSKLKHWTPDFPNTKNTKRQIFPKLTLLLLG